MVQHPTDPAKSYSKTVQTQNAVEIRPISSQVSGTTWVDRSAPPPPPGSPPDANKPRLSVTVTPGDLDGRIVAWYINGKRYGPRDTMAGVPITYPRETARSSTDTVVGGPGGIGGAWKPNSRTFTFTFTALDCGFVSVRPLFSCGTVSRASDTDHQIQIVNSAATNTDTNPPAGSPGGGPAPAPASGSGNTPAPMPPPQRPIPPQVTVQVKTLESDDPEAASPQPASTETQLVVFKGSTLTLQANLTFDAKATDDEKTRAGYSYTWCCSPPNPIVERNQGKTGPAAPQTPAEPDPVEITGGDMSLAKFKFNKPGTYTVRCRVDNDDPCLGVFNTSQEIMVWVPDLDLDMDCNADGQITSLDEGFEETVGRKVHVQYAEPPDWSKMPAEKGPPDLVIRRISPPDFARLPIRLKIQENGQGVRPKAVKGRDGKPVIVRNRTQSSDLWQTLNQGDLELYLAALAPARDLQVKIVAYTLPGKNQKKGRKVAESAGTVHLVCKKWVWKVKFFVPQGGKGNTGKTEVFPEHGSVEKVSNKHLLQLGIDRAVQFLAKRGVNLDVRGDIQVVEDEIAGYSTKDLRDGKEPQGSHLEAVLKELKRRGGESSYYPVLFGDRGPVGVAEGYGLPGLGAGVWVDDWLTRVKERNDYPEAKDYKYGFAKGIVHELLRHVVARFDHQYWSLNDRSDKLEDRGTVFVGWEEGVTATGVPDLTLSEGVQWWIIRQILDASETSLADEHWSVKLVDIPRPW